MRFDLIDQLPFVRIILTNEGKTAELANVLLDTGSASTVIPLGMDFMTKAEMVIDVYISPCSKKL